MIEIEHLSGSWGREDAITNVDLRLRNGVAYAVVGAEGAGKSTLLDLIAGVLPAAGGMVTVSGYDLATRSREAKRRIGYLPASSPDFPDMTVYEFLAFVAAARGVHGLKAERQIRDAVALCGLEKVQDRLLRTLPEADRRRVGIAQTLPGDTETLLLDEPLSGLSPRMATTVLSILSSLKGKYTLVITTADLSVLHGLCDRVICLEQGRVISEEAIADETVPPETALPTDSEEVID